MTTKHGRYQIVVDLVNSSLDILNKLSTEYLKIGRSNPVEAYIKFQSSVNGKHPETSTRNIKFYVKAIRATGAVSSENIRIYGVDAYSWFMNINRPIGTVYDGSISDVIRKVVGEVAPQINLNITETTDDKDGLWYTNRMTPMAFVEQLLNIATVTSKSMTPWVINIDGDNITMQDEGSIEATTVGYYKIGTNDVRDVISWDVIANGGHSNESMAIATSGIDGRLGVLYNDIIIEDSNTPNKKYPLIADAGFINPKTKYKEGLYGYSYAEALPDLLLTNNTIPYSEYIKVNAINEYYKRLKKLNAGHIVINGHGVYDNTTVSGIGVVFIEAVTINGQRHQLHGNWIVDEYEHEITLPTEDDEESTDGNWVTKLFVYRFDKNSTGESVSYGQS